MAKGKSKGPRRTRVRVTAITPVRAVVRRVGPPPVPDSNRHVVHHIHHMGPSMRPAAPLARPLAPPGPLMRPPIVPRPLMPPVRPGVPPIGGTPGGMRPPGPFTVPGPVGPAPGAPLPGPMGGIPPRRGPFGY